MNTVVLIGNLARDPELRYTNNGKAVANLTVAVNRGFGKDNEADFIRVVVWEKQAENCANYLAKGRKVAVEGRLQVSSYEAKDGSTRYSTDVVARVVEFLGGGDGSSGNQPGASSSPSGKSQQGSSGINPDEEIDLDEFKAMEDDEDLPF